MYLIIYSDGISSVYKIVNDFNEILEIKKQLEDRKIVGNIDVYEVKKHYVIALKERS